MKIFDTISIPQKLRIEKGEKSMKKEFLMLDDVIAELELVQEKANLVCDDLVSDYLTTPDSHVLKFYQNRARIQGDMLLDYLYQMQEKIKELKTLME